MNKRNKLNLDLDLIYSNLEIIRNYLQVDKKQFSLIGKAKANYYANMICHKNEISFDFVYAICEHCSHFSKVINLDSVYKKQLKLEIGVEE